MNIEEITTAQVPSACTLRAADQPLRLAEFDELFTAAVRGVERSTPQHLRLTLADSPGRKSAVQQLVAREAQCCSFFMFTVTDEDGLVLDVAVPPEQIEVLDAIARRAELLSQANR